MIHIGGFTPWAFKYTDGHSQHGHGGVETEWESVRVSGLKGGEGRRRERGGEERGGGRRGEERGGEEGGEGRRGRIPVCNGLHLTVILIWCEV